VIITDHLGVQRLRILAIALFGTGLVYLVKGYVSLSQTGLRDTDLRHRVTGVEQIRAGHHLYDAATHVAPDAPWGWLMNYAVYWPPPTNLWYYGLLIAVTALLLMGWAYATLSPAGRVPALTMAAAVLAISALCTGIGLGQNAPFVVLAVVGSLWFAERGQYALAGVCLGMAMIKPNLAAPFAIPFLVQPNIVVLGAAGIYMAAATVWLAWSTSITPIAAVTDWLTYVGNLTGWAGYGPYQAITALGVPQPIALTTSAIVVAAIGGVAIYTRRRAPLLMLFALAATTARLWSYHQLYGNLIVAVLLVALGVLACRRDDRVALAACGAVGVSLWLPGRLCDFAIVQWLQTATWITGAWVVWSRSASK
jgi:hypothetical protein